MKNDTKEQALVSDPQGAVDVAGWLSKLNPFQIHKRGKRGKALFALFLVCIFWGTTWIASKEGVRHMPALQLAGMRQFLGGLCYVIFFTYKGYAWPKKQHWAGILVLSFLNFMLSNALSTWGIKYISAGLGSIIGSIFPLWLVIIAMIGTKTKVARGTVFGILLGFTGICVIFYEHLGDLLNPDFRLGILLSLASTWSWAFGTLYTKKHALQFNPYFGLGLQMLISGAVVYIISDLIGQSVPVRQIPWQSWTAIIYLVVFGSILAFVAYLYALQNLPTEQASLYAYINPVIAVLAGALLFGEKLTVFIIAGAIITLAGVYIVNRTVSKLS